MISIILGLGLATIFRKICKDGNCMEFLGVPVSEFKGKIYKQDDKCYKYETKGEKCAPETKRVINIGKLMQENFAAGRGRSGA